MFTNFQQNILFFFVSVEWRFSLFFLVYESPSGALGQSIEERKKTLFSLCSKHFFYYNVNYVPRLFKTLELVRMKVGNLGNFLNAINSNHNGNLDETWTYCTIQGINNKSGKCHSYQFEIFLKWYSIIIFSI